MLLFLMATPPDLLAPLGEKALVLLFVRSDCPISNGYALEIRRLNAKHSSKGIPFRLIYPEPGLTAAAMEKHLQEYSYQISARRDYLDIGNAKLEASRHNLEQALDAVGVGKSLRLRQAKAVGCVIETVQ
jgi:hypothetical protein